MLRWMGPKHKGVEVTEDPLAALDPTRKDIYSVSRSVYLPRVQITKSGDTGGGNAQTPLVHIAPNDDNFRFRVNPLFVDNYREKTSGQTKDSSRQSTPSGGEKSSSSGYGGSHGYSSGEATYVEMELAKHSSSSEDTSEELSGILVERNRNYVRSIQIPKSRHKSTLSSGSSGTLSAIPEGQIDDEFSIPRPVWPNRHQRRKEYDSLVDEAVLLYTSLNERKQDAHPECTDVSIRDMLTDLCESVNATMQGKGVLSAEQMLHEVNAKIVQSLEALKDASEEEMRLLCVNLRNSRKMVIRALSNSSTTSGNSSQGSPVCVLHSDNEPDEIYQNPSGSSSSGFSDKLLDGPSASALPMFVHEDLASVPNGIRNAMIYGTLCRGHKLNATAAPKGKQQKQKLLKIDDEKPSVWEQYYGMNVQETQQVVPKVINYVPKATDVPIYPGGRPEADFTLDLPRSEMLSKRMKEDKKWRCRCRLLTTFLGLVFFLLSVMAVSLLLTRGRRMFGSMV